MSASLFFLVVLVLVLVLIVIVNIIITLIPKIVDKYNGLKQMSNVTQLKYKHILE